MHAKLFRGLVISFVFAATSLLVASSADAQSGKAKAYVGELFPLSKVVRGQKGYGLTTMKGTTPERFEFEVIGVNRNFLPKMDIILVKSDDPKVQITGFWQGMSGSPLYIEGKLTCAFSYGFRFNKLAIGGCTPLHYMQAEGFQERRGADNVKSRSGGALRKTAKSQHGKRDLAPRNASSLATWLDIAPAGDVGKAFARNNKRKPWLLSETLPRRASRVDAGQGMQASAVPMALSGFSAPAFAEAKRVMSGFPVEPMQAGGTGNSNAGPTEFQMGGAIAVQLVRGDMSAAATGTVSYVDGDGVLAFGHPMFQAGEVYAPVAAAEIHTVIPSAQNAFIVSSPLRELGALTQDRQSTIAADTSLKVDMIPMHIRIKSDSGKSIGNFNVEILNSRFFTATFASMAASNAASLYLADRDHISLRMTSKVEMVGHKALVFVDHLHSARGAAGIIGGSRGLRVISPLMNNPFGDVEISSIDLEIEVAFDTNTADITGLTLPKSELIPGQINYVNVRIEPYQGKEFYMRLAFDVPAGLAGSVAKLEVAAGDIASMFVAPPKTTADLVAAFRSLLPGTVFAVTLYSAQEAAAIDGKLILDLPSSALNRMRTASSTESLTTRRVQSRQVHPAKRVVDGQASILVKVGKRP
ncbi:MAG: hypothetical protein GY811_11445 [Myxococcales bacterium]|nr:hypothetical protein [Myxococcales bacterium]